MVSLVWIPLTVVRVKTVWGRHLLCFLASIGGPSALTAPRSSCILWDTSKSRQTNIVLHQLTFLWLTLFNRINVKWEPVTANLGEAADCFRCDAAHYEFTMADVFQLYLEKCQEGQKNTHWSCRMPSQYSAQVTQFLLSCPAMTLLLIFAGLCGRTFIRHLRSFYQNHRILAWNPASISEMQLLKWDKRRWRVGLY